MGQKYKKSVNRFESVKFEGSGSLFWKEFLPLSVVPKPILQWQVSGFYWE
jgi:hypothetical protein